MRRLGLFPLLFALVWPKLLPGPVLYPESAARSAYATQRPTARLPETATVRVTPSPASRYDVYFVNPLLAFEMGLTASPRSVPEPVYRELLGWLVHAREDGTGEAESVRLPRDGRAIYTGYTALVSAQGALRPQLARVGQIGDLETGRYGAHLDGHLDAVEAIQLMVVGEILHRHGVYTSRGLLAARIRNTRRRIAVHIPDAAPAGVALRVGDRPRYVDRTRGTYFDALSRAAPDWGHPLVVEGLDRLPPERRRRIVSSVSEAILKDLWALHGSLTNENSSEAVVDLGTFAFLYEPNPYATIVGGATHYQDEVRRGIETEGGLFLDAFAFHQLRRVGLPDDAILSLFFVKAREATGQGDFVFFRARPETLAFAAGILALEQLVEASPGNDFQTDEWDRSRTYYRVVLHTRKLLRALVESPRGYLGKPSLSDSDLGDLVDEVISPLFARENPLFHRLAHVRPRHYQSLRDVHAGLARAAPYLALHRDEVARRARDYPLHQHLPARSSILRAAEGWLRDPFSFLPGFVDWIDGLDPVSSRDRWREFYRAPVALPHDPARALFLRAVEAESAVRCGGRLEETPGLPDPGPRH